MKIKTYFFPIQVYEHPEFYSLTPWVSDLQTKNTTVILQVRKLRKALMIKVKRSFILGKKRATFEFQ